MTGLTKPTRGTRREHPTDTTGLRFEKEHFARDGDYRAYVRSHPCAIRHNPSHKCWRTIECAHIRTGGMGIKASDYASIPLCFAAHQLMHEMEWPRFEEKFGINRYEIAFALVEAWVKRTVR